MGGGGGSLGCLLYFGKNLSDFAKLFILLQAGVYPPESPPLLFEMDLIRPLFYSVST